METYLSDQDLYLFDTMGFLHVENFLAENEVQTYRSELGTLHTAPCDFANTVRFEKLAQQSELFQALACNPGITRRINDVINQPYRLIESYATRRTAGSVLHLHGGLSEMLHYEQGTASRTMSIYHTFHNGKIYCMYVKALIYLEDIQKLEDGPFCYIQGSHKANYPLHQVRLQDGKLVPLAQVGFPSLSTLYVKAGDLLLLNESLMHGTYPKISHEPERTILAFSYAPSFASDWRPLERPIGDIFTSGYLDADVEEQYTDM